MARIIGKLTKLGRNDYNGLVIEIDCCITVSVHDRHVQAVMPYVMGLKMYSEIEISVSSYKGRPQLDVINYISEPTKAGSKFLKNLPLFYKEKKDTDSTNQQHDDNTQDKG